MTSKANMFKQIMVEATQAQPVCWVETPQGRIQIASVVTVPIDNKVVAAVKLENVVLLPEQIEDLGTWIQEQFKEDTTQDG